MHLLIFLAIPLITYYECWAILFMNFTTIIDFVANIYLIGEWPFSYLMKCEKPYSTYWAINGHFLFTITCWREIVRNFIDVLTFNIFGVGISHFFAFIFEMCLPSRVYCRYSSLYRDYYNFLNQYRP